MDLNKLSNQVLRGRKIEDCLGKFNWKDFEFTIGDIFRQNEFMVRNNVRFKTKRRYEIDLVASRNGLVFCVDCKRWSRGREKRWGLAKAAKEQEKRTKELRRFLESNPIAQGIMKLSAVNFVPVIATLHEENILREGRTFVVPVKKLNSFIIESDKLF